MLAREKGSGVVDEEIWCKCKSKVGLKVEDREESNEILKTGDGADIRLAGGG